ncbi:ligase-associated DNA damage response DEXH box helicase [Algoriphagus antarcticus]|uniref:ATP-dependent Lhr-like helicase n=1 Tax=Algoriphagus antarcticus TaxID=238540 RepID=A0A3E0DGK1_9BACT|nr:ligase-associated DNA damage response DEXH box helicase [Algoriphagus antarcticus]REG81215.1 ATP-dependent Lhr-like helicase [Algoriphagus antarcticus]
MNSFAEVWFSNQGWTAHAFQTKTWSAMAKGRSGLLNAPTGYGKTMAIWFGVLHHYYIQRKVKKIKDTPKLHCLWITPLRALSSEIYQATKLVSDDLALDYQIGLRTGDTSTKLRQDQKKKPPQSLVTTPESIHILMAGKGYLDYFSDLEFVVVDEWHELMGSKRGVLVELALSRLKAINPKLKIWGISATIGNLEEAKDILLGHENQGVMIKSNIKKKLQIETLLPDLLERFPWAGHLGVHMAEKVIPIIEQSQSTLLFTNTRSQAEIWYRQLLELKPEWAGTLALHHGSLSNEIRVWVEAALHEGSLKAVICTSSLDLGVDFRPVDAVVQIGSPKGIARFLQRAGRSGHQPGALSRIYFLPTHSLEIMEGASLKYAIKEGMMERRIPYIRSFDVLIQYLVTLAISEGFKAKETYEEVKSTHCFSSITKEEFNECLLMITKGGRSLGAYDEFHKVVAEQDVFKVTSRRIAHRHLLNIGTIVSDAMMQVKYMSGKYLGTIEEWFISRLKPGDTFWFSGRNLELIMVREMQALVRNNSSKKGIVPSWMGGRLPLSADLGVALRHSMDVVHQPINRNNPELEFLRPLFQKQSELSALPEEGTLLIESIQTKYGYHLFVYPFEGKFVHEGMAAVIAFRLSKIRKATFSIATNEYGFELLCDAPIPIEEALEKSLFNTEDLLQDIRLGINTTEMARRRFRDIASIGGLVFQGYPGKPIKTKHLQANSSLFFSVFEDYDPGNLLLRQAYDEVMDFQLESARMYAAFVRIGSHAINLTFPIKLTPFSFPIFTESFRERYSNEDWQTRLSKLKETLEK